MGGILLSVRSVKGVNEDANYLKRQRTPFTE